MVAARRTRNAWLLPAALLICGCSFGLYEDTGSVDPGQWWPWVCSDGGTPNADSGCEVRCEDGALSNADGGC
jgi:hypothetical protein